MAICDQYNLDNVFTRFKVIEFPTSFVELTTVQTLDVEVNLKTSAYLKTMHEGRLLKFEEAREISASHRAYELTPVGDHAIRITFRPTNECISKASRSKQIDNRFVFDLRLIRVDGWRCCDNESHSEVGRYYISGQFEYCKITHEPNIIDFGQVVINNKVIKHVRIRNESKLIAAKFQYFKVNGFEVSPQKFIILPNSSKRIAVTIKPTCLKIGNALTFKIRNPYDLVLDDEEYNNNFNMDENFLTYNISCQSNIIYPKNSNQKVIESLHNLHELDKKYTYINEELTTHTKNNKKAFKYLEICKTTYVKKPVIERFCTGKDRCLSLKSQIPDTNFCKIIREKITTYELFDILVIPSTIDFGRVGLHTYGEKDLILKNKTKCDVTIKLLNKSSILYTGEKHERLTIKIRPMNETKVTLFCFGFQIGRYRGSFEYIIDNLYYKKHVYTLQVGTPTLMIQEKCLKFGMVTSESYIMSVPVRIHNSFNVPVNFKWNELHQDTPFEIIPSSGFIPPHASRICDVSYLCTPTKTKTHEVDFISENKTIIPIELSIVTRKISIKFLQQAVFFKDIALNLETIERVKLENSSREIAVFYVVEPLIPGLSIEPMCGTIRPKMILTFEIIVKISCVLEFAVDIYVKINNKENIILPVSGNVVEPKIIIQPKNIYMARVPCDMITYVPVTFQNLSSLKTVVEVLDTGDENIFGVYIAQGNEKQKVFEFVVEGGQNKIVFIKVHDIFRREYEMYIPFKINGLLGPPDHNACSTEFQHYIGEFAQYYENNPRVKLKTLNKDISYCRVIGVITVPWIQFSVEKFEIDYIPNGSNIIEFTMKNISKYLLFVTILTSKLAPNFSLDLRTDKNLSIINETTIKFELGRDTEVALSLKFHPRGHGKFISTALLYLDKQMTLPYYNLTFIGKRQTSAMTPSTYRVIFPPCHVGTEMTRILTIKLEAESDMDSFYYEAKEESNLRVTFTDLKIIKEQEENHTEVTVEIKVCCNATYAQNLTVTFNHESGSGCDVEVYFCFTYCVLTLHTNFLVQTANNPYPYFPLKSQTELYEYLDTCTKFLEKWMFQQGFRRDLYPVIPDTFHAISSAMSSQSSAAKSKGINVSYLNFIRRISGPLMKNVHKILVTGVDDSFKCVKEIHDTYKEIINLLKCRGANSWLLQARFLLSYDQFIIHSENVTPKCNADIILTRELLADVNLFNRLSKQSWIDFILQSYKVFVMDSCFFDCVCVSSQPRDIIKVLMDWYNEHIMLQHGKLCGKNKPVKLITNITTDLSDGIAVASTIINYCPFLENHFSIFCEVGEDNKEGGIINNACLIIEVLNLLKMYFPICSKDFLKPNFLQMLFLSIHLYVTLPTFKPKDTIHFNPPLLRSSTRLVGISPTSQESLIFTYMVLNNLKNNFVVEKAPSGENGKKMFLSVKYVANFIEKESCILLVHGYNKTRIFDAYLVFLLHGEVGVLNPLKKCKVSGPLYRPNKVDVLVSSPFMHTTSFHVYLTDIEPVIPVRFDEFGDKPRFYLRRLNLIDKEITLSGKPKESGQDVLEHKLYLQMICLSTQIGNTWIWFRSELGEFFIRVTSQPRWDMAIDTLQTRVKTWPMEPCSCGESCECYRTTILMIPHRNELMLKSLRHALLEHTSDAMMRIFDHLIGTTTGKIILGMLLTEGATNMSDVNHILRSESTYRISSRALIPRLDRVTLAQHTAAMLALPITVPAQDKSEKYSVTFTSDCGMDIRTYKILFIETFEELSN